jgi:spore cortex formation protein SpoVR/YcgB (stage V sporulation)
MLFLFLRKEKESQQHEIDKEIIKKNYFSLFIKGFLFRYKHWSFGF